MQQLQAEVRQQIDFVIDNVEHSKHNESEELVKIIDQAPLESDNMHSLPQPTKHSRQDSKDNVQTLPKKGGFNRTSSFQPSPSPGCSSRVQTSNRLLLEFLTQNSANNDNFMSTQKLIMQQTLNKSNPLVQKPEEIKAQRLSNLFGQKGRGAAIEQAILEESDYS